MFIGIVEHDSFTVGFEHRSAGMPQGVVEHEAGTRRAADLDRVRHRVESFELPCSRGRGRFVRPRYDHEVSLVRRGHV